jgi:hypothetical protein
MHWSLDLGPLSKVTFNLLDREDIDIWNYLVFKNCRVSFYNQWLCGYIGVDQGIKPGTSPDIKNHTGLI